MDTLFLDTNVIIRYLTRDDADKAERARTLLKQAERGDLTLMTSESIVVECVQVLSSRNLYNQPREKVASDLTTILTLRALKLTGKRTVLRALVLWADSSVDFVDALSLAQMEQMNITTIASFDRDFDRFKEITRLEP